MLFNNRKQNGTKNSIDGHRIRLITVSNSQSNSKSIVRSGFSLSGDSRTKKQKADTTAAASRNKSTAKTKHLQIGFVVLDKCDVDIKSTAKKANFSKKEFFSWTNDVVHSTVFSFG